MLWGKWKANGEEGGRGEGHRRTDLCVNIFIVQPPRPMPHSYALFEQCITAYVDMRSISVVGNGREVLEET